MPRDAYPIEFHLLKNNKNRLTKKEIKDRINSKIKIGTQNFIMPSIIKKNKTAKDKWKELISLFVDSNIDIVTNCDTDLITRYCLTYSEYVFVLKVKNDIVNSYKTNMEKHQELITNKIYEKLAKLSELLLQMENNLYLTPLSRARQIIRQGTDKQENDPLKKLGFDI